MRLLARPWIALFALGALLACGTPPAPKPPAAAPARTAAPPPPAPRCKASDPNAPGDARSVMKQAGEDVKGCFLLGKTTSAPGSVAIDLGIHEDGSVARKKVRADGAEGGQITCVENVLGRLKFARFCGNDVELQWSYALAR